MKFIHDIKLFLGLLIAVLITSCKAQYSCPLNKSRVEKLNQKVKYEVKGTYQKNILYKSFSNDSIIVYGNINDRINGEPLSAIVGVVNDKDWVESKSTGYYELKLLKGNHKLQVINGGNTTLITKEINFQSNVNINFCLGTTIIK